VARRLRVRLGVLFTALLLALPAVGAAPAAVAATSPVIDGIDVRLPTGNSISGTLKNGDGDPITGFALSACTPDEDCVGDGETDGAGAFKIKGLLPGSYLIQFSPLGARPGDRAADAEPRVGDHRDACDVTA